MVNPYIPPDQSVECEEGRDSFDKNLRLHAAFLGASSAAAFLGSFVYVVGAAKYLLGDVLQLDIAPNLLVGWKRLATASGLFLLSVGFLSCAMALFRRAGAWRRFGAVGSALQFVLGLQCLPFSLPLSALGLHLGLACWRSIRAERLPRRPWERGGDLLIAGIGSIYMIGFLFGVAIKLFERVADVTTWGW